MWRKYFITVYFSLVATTMGTLALGMNVEPEHIVYAQVREPVEVPIILLSEVPTDDEETEIKKVFPDAPIMLEVARCESQLTHYTEGGEPLEGRVDADDTGVFQINKRYHQQAAEALGLDINDLHDNIKYARVLYDQQGLTPWNASAPCWSK